MSVDLDGGGRLLLSIFVYKKTCICQSVLSILIAHRMVCRYKITFVHLQWLDEDGGNL